MPLLIVALLEGIALIGWLIRLGLARLAIEGRDLLAARPHTIFFVFSKVCALACAFLFFSAKGGCPHNGWASNRLSLL